MADRARYLDVWGAFWRGGRRRDLLGYVARMDDADAEGLWEAITQADADEATPGRLAGCGEADVGHDESVEGRSISGAMLPGPFASYPGGKGAAGSAQQIISRFPAHGLYIEPFLGGGAVLRAKVPALASVGIDLDDDVIAAWRRVAMPGLQLVHGHGITWLEDRADLLPQDALVYADPPYPAVTLVKRRARYRHEFTEADHRRLLAVLAMLPCSVFVSSYDNALYQRELSADRGWEHAAWQAPTRGRGRREHLWWRLSGVASQSLIDHPDMAGSGFRERERVRKLIGRWRSNFERRSAAERHGILRALLAAEGQLREAGGQHRRKRR